MVQQVGDNQRNILIVEDNEHDAELMLRELLKSMAVRRHAVVTTDPALRGALEQERWDAVLSDYSIPGFGAMEALRTVRASGQDIPFVVVTGSIDEETAVSCLKRGVDDYILKESLTRLGPAVEQAIAAYDERRRRHALEEHLRQSQKMEALGRLASGVVHEFNNLLSIIFVGVARLKTVVGPGEATESLDVIQEAAEHARNVTTSLLTFSQRSGTTMAPLDLVALLDDAVRLFRQVIPSRITISVRRPEHAKVWVRADATQIHQVLMNLAINARDAMSGEGRLSFGLFLRPGKGEAPEAAVLTVEDDGPGMSEPVRLRAFEPFFTTKSADRGTGLGLSIVHGIVDAHGGQIALSSAPGRGTRITVTLPTCPAPAGVEPARVQRPAEGALAMLVEDNTLMRGLMMTSLGAIGLKVIEARDGEEARRLLQSSIRDLRLLVVDQGLPKTSGTAVLDEAARLGWSGPSLVVTGDPEFTLGPRYTGTSVLRKPFHIGDFQRLCTDLLARAPGQPAPAAP